MLIRCQDSGNFVNIKNGYFYIKYRMKMEYEYNVEKEQGYYVHKHCVVADLFKVEILLGIYDTEERAKDVVNMIWEAVKNDTDYFIMPAK